MLASALHGIMEWDIPYGSLQMKYMYSEIRLIGFYNTNRNIL